MKLHRVLVAGLVLGAAGPGVAASAAQAQGITNPAKNPSPVTVTIDGQTYSDGRDTLPGYDDELCTPIPAVQYDFADNQILYYNNEGELLKTAHWTEWARISSYQTWLDQQNAATPTPTATATATATPAATSSAPTSSESTSSAPTSSATQGPASSSPTTTKSPASKQSTTKKKNTTSTKKPASERPSATRQSTSSPSSPSTTSTTSKQPAAAPTEQSRTSTGSDAPTNDAASAAPPVDGAPVGEAATTGPADASAPLPGAATPAPVSSAASSEPTTKFKLASERVGTVGMGDTRPAGIGILVALLALAGISFLFRGYARR